MKKTRLLMLLPMLFLLSSCVGKEPNDRAYVTAIGIDKADVGYLYTIQFAKPDKISGGSSESGGSGGDIVENISVEAPTIYSAINNANAIVSKDFTMSHAKILVVSEEVAAEGMNGINDTLARNNETRPGMYIAIAENAGEYLEEVKPVIELNPSKYYQLTYENKNGSRTPQNNAIEFYFSCVSDKEDCVLPLAGTASAEEDSETTNESGGEESGDKSIINESQSNAPINESGFENMTRNQTAGEAGVSIKNKSETMGMAVFKSDKYIGKLGSTETEIYNILIGKFRDDYITFRDDNSDTPVTLKIEEKTYPEYEIDIDNKSVKINVILESNLQSTSYNYQKTVEEIESKAAEMVDKRAEDFIKTVYKEMGADVLGIRGRIKGKFLTINEYDKYCENFDPSEWNIEVNTKMRMKRTEMTYYN